MMKKSVYRMFKIGMSPCIVFGLGIFPSVTQEMQPKHVKGVRNEEKLPHKKYRVSRKWKRIRTRYRQKYTLTLKGQLMKEIEVEEIKNGSRIQK